MNNLTFLSEDNFTEYFQFGESKVDVETELHNLGIDNINDYVHHMNSEPSNFYVILAAGSLVHLEAVGLLLTATFPFVVFPTVQVFLS